MNRFLLSLGAVLMAAVSAPAQPKKPVPAPAKPIAAKPIAAKPGVKPVAAKPTTVQAPTKPAPAGELRFVPPVGHTDNISQIALSPDGKWLATGSRDSTVRVWETATGRTSRVLSVPGAIQSVQCVRWLSDSRRLLVGSDGALRLWDAPAGKILRDWGFKTDPSQVNALSRTFAEVIPTADEKQLLTLTSGGDGSVELWDLSSGALLHGYANVPQATCAAFADGGKTVVVSDYLGHLFRWNTATEKPLGEVQTHCYARHFSADGRYLIATASRPVAGETLPAGVKADQLVILDAATGKLIRVAAESAELNNEGGAFSPDSKWVVIADAAPGMHALEIATGRVVKPRPEAVRGIEVEAVEARPSKTNGFGDLVSFRADGKGLASSDGVISRVWDWPDFKPQRVLRGWDLNPDSAVTTPDGHYALLTTAGQNTGVLRFFDLTTGRMLRSLPFVGHIHELLLSPDGQNAYYGTDYYGTAEVKRYELCHWNLTTGELSTPIAVPDARHDAVIHPVTLTPDDKQLLFRQDGSLHLWDVATGRIVKTMPDMGGKIGLDAAGHVLCEGTSSTLSTWDFETGQKVSQTQFFDQKWAALPDRQFYSTDDDHLKQFLHNGHSVLEAAHYEKAIGEKQGTSFVERDCASGQILRVFEGEAPDQNLGTMAISPDETRLLSLDWDTHHLKLWDMATGRVLQDIVDSEQKNSPRAGSLALLPGNKLFLSWQGDGTLRVRDLKTAKTVFSYLTLENGDWLAYTADGHFDGSPGAIEKCYFEQNGQTFSLDQFAERFYQPGLVDLTLRGTGLSPAPNAATVLAQGAPPTVKITSPQTGLAAGGEIEVSVEASAQNGGGVKAIRLYHNGRLVGGPANLRSIVVEAAFPGAGAPAPPTLSQKFSVSLVPGANTLRAVAYSQSDLESRPDDVDLQWNAPPRAKPKLFVLAVGINAYQDASMNLTYARPDAQAMADFFAADTAAFSGVKVTRLLDADGSRANISAALAAMASECGADDVALIYLAGHGDTAAPDLAHDKDENAPQTFYFLPADADGMTLKEQVRRGGLSGPTIDELVSKIPARKVLMIYDACKSGAAVDTLTRAGAQEEQALAMLARAQGIYVLSASNGQQYAGEVRALGHGILTYALLEGLGGKAADVAKAVRVKNLLDYSKERVPALSKEYRGREQWPELYGRGQNFPLVTQK